MTPPKGLPRTRPITAGEIRVRAATARKYLEVSELVLGEELAERQVAGGLAVLAAIAASDAICGIALGVNARGQDHDQAPELLRTVQPDGPELAKRLAHALEHKAVAHYGTSYLSDATVRSMVRQATSLVDAMDARLRQ